MLKDLSLLMEIVTNYSKNWVKLKNWVTLMHSGSKKHLVTARHWVNVKHSGYNWHLGLGLSY